MFKGSLLRKITIGCIALIIVGYVLQLTGVVNSATGKMYTIDVYDGYNYQTFFSDSIISNDGRCIKFYDAFGFLQTQCAENISVTDYTSKK
jgi:hypothetical protein